MIYAKNIKKTEDSTFNITITQEFVGTTSLDLTDGQILGFMIGGLIIFCSCSIAFFFIFRKKRVREQSVILTESEEHYMSLRSLRIMIRKAQKQGKSMEEIQ